MNECSNPPAGTVFCNDFDTSVTTDAQRRAQWDDYDGATDVDFPQDNGPSQNASNHVAQFLVPQNTSSVDDLVKVLSGSYQKLYLRYYTKYASGFPFTMGNHGGGLVAGDRAHLATSGYRPGDSATPSGSDEWADFRIQYQSGSNPIPFAYSYNVGMYQDWSRRALDIEVMCESLVVSDVLEAAGMEEGSDLADYLIYPGEGGYYNMIAAMELDLFPARSIYPEPVAEAPVITAEPVRPPIERLTSMPGVQALIREMDLDMTTARVKPIEK